MAINIKYNPELIYIKGTSNIVADALSRLDLLPDPLPMNITTNELLNLDEIPSEEFPVRYALIEREQLKENALQKRVNEPGFSRKQFCGGTKSFNLVCYNDKIVIPVTLRERLVKWYHEMLVHPMSGSADPVRRVRRS